MFLKSLRTAATVGAMVLGLAATTTVNEAQAAPVDADLMFVIDRTTSMNGEFNFLGGAIGTFLSDLQADARIGTVQIGLTVYNAGANLVQSLTGNVAQLQAAFASINTSGGTENAFSATEFGINATLNDANLQAGSVRSIILVTDEDSDDIGNKASADAALTSSGFLNNIIYNEGSGSSAAHFNDFARPATGLFSINQFRNDRAGFFAQFTNAKIQEIVTANPIPLPMPALLLLSGIGGLGLMRSRKKPA